MFINIIENPHTYYGILKLYQNGDAVIEFIQNLEYKYVELLTLNFATSDEKLIRESISYRYNITKVKMIYYKNKLTDFSNMIKAKNPSLLVNYKKNKAILNKTNYTINTNQKK